MTKTARRRADWGREGIRAELEALRGLRPTALGELVIVGVSLTAGIGFLFVLVGLFAVLAP
ncbi:membrane protein [Arthrobacter phage Prairie]|uniref:Membrane protein n=2 Tax=Lilmacvirus TaxID=3425005 RepID=A0AAE8XLF1_9CAUD|nr:membrane protein [Arthrobacter phage Prairie]UAW09394.1 membrane protein [Arthrobacter phage Klevey]